MQQVNTNQNAIAAGQHKLQELIDFFFFILTSPRRSTPPSIVVCTSGPFLPKFLKHAIFDFGNHSLSAHALYYCHCIIEVCLLCVRRKYLALSGGAPMGNLICTRSCRRARGRSAAFKSRSPPRSPPRALRQRPFYNALELRPTAHIAINWAIRNPKVLHPTIVVFD